MDVWSVWKIRSQKHQLRVQKKKESIANTGFSISYEEEENDIVVDHNIQTGPDILQFNLDLDRPSLDTA